MGKSKDPIFAAQKVLDHIVAKYDPAASHVPPPQPKNEKAQVAGKLGGTKGGKARAAKLSPEKRRAIARKAASVRWKHKSEQND
jgi:hypothetical protein